jgi:phage replication O-like protein O
MNRIKPNFTQVPNELLDNIHLFSGAEVRILVVICRQTFGWHKDKDKISLTQFEKKTGLSRPSINSNLKSLESQRVIKKYSGSINSYEYITVVNSVNYKDESLVNSINQTSKLSLPPLVNSVNTQKKLDKRKYTKEKNAEKSAKFVVEYFNKISGKKIKLSKQRARHINATLESVSLKELCYSIHNLIRDKWSIEKGQIRLDRLINPGKRDRNLESFSHYPFNRIVKHDIDHREEEILKASGLM